MRDALYYEYTFKFCYNSPIKIPPLGSVGWSSSGGSITSVVNRIFIRCLLPFLMRCFTIYPEKKMLISEAVWKTLQHGAVSAIIHLTANLVMEKKGGYLNASATVKDW